MISRAIEPKTQAEKEKLDFGLGKLADEDPTFRFGEDTETGQTIIRGMGELHLDILVDRLRREYGVDANVGRPAGRVPGDAGRGRRGRGPLRAHAGGRVAVRSRPGAGGAAGPAAAATSCGWRW